MTPAKSCQLISTVIATVPFCINLSQGQTSLPSTEQFMNALSVCALDLKFELKGDIQGSIRTFYEGVKTQGQISNQTTSNFISLFPQTDRINAYRIYSECVLKIVGIKSSGDAGGTISFPSFEARLLPGQTGEFSGPIIAVDSNSPIFNLGYSTRRYYEVQHSCARGFDFTRFPAAAVGPFRAYNREERAMYIAEHRVWNHMPTLFKKVLDNPALNCIRGIELKVYYRFQFEDQRNNRYVRYYQSEIDVSRGREKANSMEKRVGFDESDEEAWNYVGSIETKIKGQPSLWMGLLDDEDLKTLTNLKR